MNSKKARDQAKLYLEHKGHKVVKSSASGADETWYGMGRPLVYDCGCAIPQVKGGYPLPCQSHRRAIGEPPPRKGLWG